MPKFEWSHHHNGVKMGPNCVNLNMILWVSKTLERKMIVYNWPAIMIGPCMAFKCSFNLSNIYCLLAGGSRHGFFFQFCRVGKQAIIQKIMRKIWLGIGHESRYIWEFFFVSTTSKYSSSKYGDFFPQNMMTFLFISPKNPFVHFAKNFCVAILQNFGGKKIGEGSKHFKM